jgi:hypothetical protein
MKHINKIKLDKVDTMGNIIDTIELDGRWIMTIGEKSYFINSRDIEEINLENIQKNFIDNL